MYINWVEGVDSWGLAATVSRRFCAGAAAVRCVVATKKVRWAGAVLWALCCAVGGVEKREEEMRMQEKRKSRRPLRSEEEYRRSSFLCFPVPKAEGKSRRKRRRRRKS
ncbi:hypothetical protein RIF29_06507 [Crotalaria pallida]|uniref:Uncharacterized protein n=1 Tax=Crotalaria pallida TaxID=3830 RepID=A0AAN9J3K2_CROPI